jgi:hypothetical protein
MTFTRCLFTVCLGSLLLGSILIAQQSNSAQSSAVVPRLVSFSGRATDVRGNAMSGVTSATFAVYKDQYEGAALWMETQNVQVDKEGHYTAQLGATKREGMPVELFTTGEPRWLGVRINGEEEQARVLLVSVPYALKAADADTLGGKPLSAFQLVTLGSNTSNTASSHQAQPAALEQANEIVCLSGTACKTGFVPLFSSNGGSANVNDSIITQSGTTIGVAGNVSAASPSAAVRGTITGAGNGIAAVAGSAIATGASGFTFGVTGQSASDTGRGVFGLATGKTGVGVIGETSAGGIGVVGKALPGSTGYAMFANGNTGQDRSSGGWVKAMVYYSGLSNGIAYCFNSTLSGAAATTPPCGFTPTRFIAGDYQIDFGFQVDDRFFSVGGAGGVNTICTDTNAAPGCAGTTVNANQAEIILQTSTGGARFDSKFYLIVY